MSSSKLPFIDASFLDLAKAASAAVGRVMRHDSMKGNGFMISNKLFLTNNHIIQDYEPAKGLVVEFNYELDWRGRPKPTTIFAFSPDEFFMRSRENDLDFTIVAIGDRVSGGNCLSDFGFCPLKEKEDTYSLGEFANIIQHPGCEFKKIMLRSSHLAAESEDVLHYYATMVSGSSGSPVFNDRFEPIALHHSGCPSRIAFAKDGTPGPKQIAEGIRISAIVKRINSEKSNLKKEQRSLIETALACPFSHPSLLNPNRTPN
jgi:endonuclease G